ncbi:MAG: VTT domain-containing protein [Noviherbaspirillum sp.]
MDFMQLVDMVLHVDKSLGRVIAEYGQTVYGVLTAIVFTETGLVVFPFLPGDTLLFIGGAFAATGELNVWLLMGLLTFAAVAGNTVNYFIGNAIGQKIFTRDYRWLDKAALHRTHAFYDNHGGKTIILARFIPVVRTFAPFVAGVSNMSFARFQFFNITGALAWVVGLVTAGYFFGNIPAIRDHLTIIVLIGVCAAVIPVALGAVYKFCRRFARN